MRIDLSAIDRDTFFVRALTHPTIGEVAQVAPPVQMKRSQFRQLVRDGQAAALDLSPRMSGG